MAKMDALSLYLKELDECVWSEEINSKLINEYYSVEKDKRSIEIRNKLVESNIRLVYWSANRFYRFKKVYIDEKPTFSIEDLISAGHIGLINGINNYDISKGYKLSSYLTTCIFNKMKDCYAWGFSLLSAPVNFKRKAIDYNKNNDNQDYNSNLSDKHIELCERLIQTDNYLNLEYSSDQVEQMSEYPIEDIGSDVVDVVSNNYIYNEIMDMLEGYNKIIFKQRTIDDKMYKDIASEIKKSDKVAQQRYERTVENLKNNKKVRKLLKEY